MANQYEIPSRYSQGSLEDLPKNITHQYSGLPFARTIQTYMVGDSLEQAFCYLAELDYIGFRRYSTEGGFFTFLEANGIRSKLIKHFALCEKGRLGYCLPRSSRALITVNSVQEKGSEDDTMVLIYGIAGFENIKAIGQVDHLFYLELFRACQDRLCEVIRVDIYMDFSTNLMRLLDKPCSEGKVQGFGGGLAKIYGTLDKESVEGKSIGSQSKFYKNNLAKKDVELLVETLYIGNPKDTPHTISFYDKKKQQANKKQQQVLIGSRIEIKLTTRSGPFYKALLPWLVLSLSSFTGTYYRQYVFFLALFTFVRISTIQQLRGTDNGYVNQDCWAPWWSRLYDLVSDYLTLFPCATKGSFFDHANHMFLHWRQLWSDPYRGQNSEENGERLAGYVNSQFLILAERIDKSWFNNQQPPWPPPSYFWISQPQRLGQACSKVVLKFLGTTKADILVKSMEKGYLEVPFPYTDYFLGKSTALAYQINPPSPEIAYRMAYLASQTLGFSDEGFLGLSELREFNEIQRAADSFVFLEEFVLLAPYLINFWNEGPKALNVEQLLRRLEPLKKKESKLNLEVYASFFKVDQQILTQPLQELSGQASQTEFAESGLDQAVVSSESQGSLGLDQGTMGKLTPPPVVEDISERRAAETRSSGVLALELAYNSFVKDNKSLTKKQSESLEILLRTIAKANGLDDSDSDLIKLLALGSGLVRGRGRPRSKEAPDIDRTPKLKKDGTLKKKPGPRPKS